LLGWLLIWDGGDLVQGGERGGVFFLSRGMWARLSGGVFQSATVTDAPLQGMAVGGLRRRDVEGIWFDCGWGVFQDVVMITGGMNIDWR